MPILENKQQEQYAKCRAKQMVPAKAAVAAGYSIGSAIYSKLEADDKILQRIAELIEEFELKKEQMRAAARASGEQVGRLTGMGRAWVLQQLAENAAMARLEGKFADSTAALIKIGEEIGMFKGGGDEKTDGSPIPSNLDFDSLSLLADQAHEAINPTPLPEFIPSEEDVTERAIRLITGEQKKKIEPLHLGSETDVALTPDASPEEDDTEQ